MNYEILSVASEDLAGAVRYYEECHPGVGGEFLDEFAAAMMLICRHPEAWKRVGRYHRRCLLRRFPFSVLYTIAGKTVYVAGIIDSRMDPRRQRERMRQT